EHLAAAQAEELLDADEGVQPHEDETAMLEHPVAVAIHDDAVTLDEPEDEPAPPTTPAAAHEPETDESEAVLEVPTAPETGEPAAEAQTESAGEVVEPAAETETETTYDAVEPAVETDEAAAAADAWARAEIAAIRARLDAGAPGPEPVASTEAWTPSRR